MNGTLTDYQGYVTAAYAIFVVVMLWDLIAPRLQIRQQLRAIRLRARRKVAPTTPAVADHDSA